MASKKKKTNKKKTSYIKKEIKKEELIPRGNKVLITPIKEQAKNMTPSGIMLPETAAERDVDERSGLGVVVAVGPGAITPNGERISIDLEVGDKVAYQYGEKFTHDFIEYYLVAESDVNIKMK